MRRTTHELSSYAVFCLKCNEKLSSKMCSILIKIHKILFKRGSEINNNKLTLKKENSQLQTLHLYMTAFSFHCDRSSLEVCVVPELLRLKTRILNPFLWSILFICCGSNVGLRFISNTENSLKKQILDRWGIAISVARAWISQIAHVLKPQNAYLLNTHRL